METCNKHNFRVPKLGVFQALGDKKTTQMRSEHQTRRDALAKLRDHVVDEQDQALLLMISIETKEVSPEKQRRGGNGLGKIWPSRNELLVMRAEQTT
jgi:hypothetical protein